MFESEISLAQTFGLCGGISPDEANLCANVWSRSARKKMFPPGISEAEIMKWFKAVFKIKKDEWMKILDAEE